MLPLPPTTFGVPTTDTGRDITPGDEPPIDGVSTPLSSDEAVSAPPSSSSSSSSTSVASSSVSSSSTMWAKRPSSGDELRNNFTDYMQILMGVEEELKTLGGRGETSVCHNFSSYLGTIIRVIHRVQTKLLTHVSGVLSEGMLVHPLEATNILELFERTLIPTSKRFRTQEWRNFVSTGSAQSHTKLLKIILFACTRSLSRKTLPVNAEDESPTGVSSGVKTGLGGD